MPNQQLYELTARPIVALTDIVGTTTSDGLNPLGKSTVSELKAGMLLNNVPNIDATNPLNIATNSSNRFVTDAQISNWNTSFGWGNHAGLYATISHNHDSLYQPLDGDLSSIAGLGGTSGLLRKTAADTWILDTTAYLTTYSETDPIFSAHVAAGITGTNISNWNTAFGWGDHSTEGYLTSETDPLALKIANNLSDIVNQALARTNLGASTTGANLFTVTNPGVIAWLRINADSSITTRSAAETLSDLGANPAIQFREEGVNQGASGGVSIVDFVGGGILASVSGSTLTVTVSALTTESDPVFTASAAFGIAAGDITNWNTAFSWGNHAGLYQPLDADLSTWATITPTTVGTNLVTLANPSAVRFIRINADNTISSRTAAELLSDIGAQAAGSYLVAGDIDITVQGYDGDLAAIAALSGTTGFLTKTAANTWALDTNTYLTTGAAAAAYQPLDSDLTTIAGLTATTDNFIVAVASAWASRTPAQVKTTLSLNNVENTALSTWTGSASITTLGTIGTGTWDATAISTTKGGAPAGGTTGQVLKKNSNTDYDYSWDTDNAGAGGLTYDDVRRMNTILNN